MLPEVAILIPTYNRRQVVMKNIESLNQNLRYDGKVQMLIGEDSDNNDLAFCYRPGYAINEIPGQHTLVSVRHEVRNGLGANLNWLLQNCETDLVIQMDDDHILLKELDITPHVRKLMEDET